VIGLLLLTLVFVPHSFPFAGAGSWSLVDLLLPGLAACYAAKAVIQYTLYVDLRSSSILPFIFLVLTLLHIISDPRLEEILKAFGSYRLATGGFKIYYGVTISILLYYTTPLIINNLGILRRFLKIYLFIIVLQVIICFFRLIFDVRTLPWDTYGSQVLSFEESSFYSGAIRFILLGKLGLLLFTYAVALIKPGDKTRRVFIILALLSLAIASGRGTLFAALFVACLFLTLELRKWLTALVTGLAIILMVATFSFTPSLLEDLPPTAKRYLSVLSPEHSVLKTDAFSRGEMWKIQLHALKRHPLWGSVHDFPRDADERAKNAVMRGDTHGVYLGIASRYGIPVFMIWFLFIGRQMRRSYLLMKNSTPGTEFHSMALWLFLALSGYLFLYITGGSAGGGFPDAYVSLAFVDVVHRLAHIENALIAEPEKQLGTGHQIL